MQIRPAYMLCMLSVMIGSLPGPTFADDDTVESAVWLLRRSTLVHRDGTHNILLRALRQLRDPSLEPLFTDLVQSSFPVMQIHGMLGLSEIDEKQRMDLGMLEDIGQPSTQAKLVLAAIDEDLLSVADAHILATKPNIDPAVQILTLVRLVAKGELMDVSLLSNAKVDRANLALRGMLALLRLQVGQMDAMDELRQISASQDPNRDRVRSMLLQSAIRYKLIAAGDWAAEIAKESDIDRALSLTALRAALLFGGEEAEKTWMFRIETAPSTAERTRIALLALDLADELEPDMFLPLIFDDQEIIQQLGVVGMTVALGESPEDVITELIDMGHPVASQWALKYASKLPLDECGPILQKLIEVSGRSGRLQSQRLQNAVLAAQELYEKDPIVATEWITPLFGEVDAISEEAILMGLIRVVGSNPQHVIDGVETWKTTAAASMALLLRAKNGERIQPERLNQLALIVRGGGGLQDPLRVQAAWIYLKLTQQNDIALAGVLKRARSTDSIR